MNLWNLERAYSCYKLSWCRPAAGGKLGINALLEFLKYVAEQSLAKSYVLTNEQATSGHEEGLRKTTIWRMHLLAPPPCRKRLYWRRGCGVIMLREDIVCEPGWEACDGVMGNTGTLYLVPCNCTDVGPRHRTASSLGGENMLGWRH